MTFKRENMEGEEYLKLVTALGVLTDARDLPFFVLRGAGVFTTFPGR